MSRKIFVASLVILLFFTIGIGKLALAQTAPAVVLNILNEDPEPMTIEIEVVQGVPVEVAFEVNPEVISSPSDLIQLRRVDDSSIIVDQKVRGDALSGTVFLDTSSDNALAVLEVVYLLNDVVFATASETVLLVSEIPPEPPDTVKFPGDAPTLQAAIDLVGHKGTVKIARGVHEVAEPIFVQGKNIILAGAGSGQNGEGPVTHLVGPPPQPVMDEQGNLILLADDVQGMLNFIGSDVVVYDMMISGFDAGIVTRNVGEGEPAPTVVKDIVITGTGRGILALSSGDLTVADVTISDTSWNGISVAPRLSQPHIYPVFQSVDLNIFGPSGAGIYFSYTHAYIHDAFVYNAQGGGIVGYQATAEILNSFIHQCHKAGILLQECYSGNLFETRIEDNIIMNTHSWWSPYASDYILGDGITLWLSGVVDIVDNYIYESERAGISLNGATAAVTDNYIICVQHNWYLAGNPYQGSDYAFIREGNGCGCGGVFETCIISTGTIQAADPVGGLE